MMLVINFYLYLCSVVQGAPSMMPEIQGKTAYSEPSGGFERTDELRRFVVLWPFAYSGPAYQVSQTLAFRLLVQVRSLLGIRKPSRTDFVFQGAFFFVLSLMFLLRLVSFPLLFLLSNPHV